MKTSTQNILAVTGIGAAMIAVFPLSVAMLVDNGPMALGSLAVVMVGTWLGCREMA